MQIDCYGFEATSVFFQRKRLQPHRVIADGDVTYLCFDDAPERCVHRIFQANGETVIEWAFGAWENRTSLAYIPINKTLEV